MDQAIVPSTEVLFSDDPWMANLSAVLKKRIFADVLFEGQLVNTIPPDLINKVLSKKNVEELFAPVFTHRSYRPPIVPGQRRKIVKPWEKTETHGDTLLNWFMSKCILIAYPNITNDEQNKLLAHYKSNVEFGKFIRTAIPEIDFPGFVRRSTYVKQLETKMYGDILEALAGAIEFAVEREMKGLGVACVENVLRVITRNFQPDKKYAAGSPKSQIIEIFGKEVNGEIAVREYPPKKSKRTKDIFKGYLRVEIDNAAKDAVLNLFPEVRTSGKFSGKLQQDTGDIAFNDRDSATTYVYQQLIDRLAAVGISTTEVPKMEMKNMIEGREDKDIIKEIMKARKETLLFIKQDSAIEGMKDWDLYGESKVYMQGNRGEREFIASVTVSKDSSKWHIYKQALLTEYVRMFKAGELPVPEVIEEPKILTSSPMPGDDEIL